MGDMETLIIILPAEGDAPLHWLRVAAGAVVARGGDDPDYGGAERLIAFAPAGRVGIDWLDLPDLPAAQRDAVAKQQLADQILEPVDAVHVVTAQGVAAWASHVDMVDWLARIARRPDHLVPLALVVQPPETGLIGAMIADQPVLRGPRLAVLADPALVQAFGEPILSLSATQIDQALIFASEEPPLDLLTGRYAARRDWIDGRTIRLLAALALLALGLFAALTIAQIWKTNRTADQLEASARADAAKQFPQAADPLADLTARVTAQRGGGAGFLPSMAAVTSALTVHPQAELTSAQFDPSGQLQVGLRVPAIGDISAITTRIEAAGFVVEQGAPVTEQGRVVVSLKVRGS
jgi:general secretion pathway protein L